MGQPQVFDFLEMTYSNLALSNNWSLLDRTDKGFLVWAMRGRGISKMFLGEELRTSQQQ